MSSVFLGISMLSSLVFGGSGNSMSTYGSRFLVRLSVMHNWSVWVSNGVTNCGVSNIVMDWVSSGVAMDKRLEVKMIEFMVFSRITSMNSWSVVRKVLVVRHIVMVCRVRGQKSFSKGWLVLSSMNVPGILRMVGGDRDFWDMNVSVIVR